MNIYVSTRKKTGLGSTPYFNKGLSYYVSFKVCDMVFSTTEKFNLKSAIVVESYHRLLSVIVTNSYALSL